jgi:uncharacterized membrane protein
LNCAARGGVGRDHGLKWPDFGTIAQGDAMSNMEFFVVALWCFVATTVGHIVRELGKFLKERQKIILWVFVLTCAGVRLAVDHVDWKVILESLVINILASLLTD